MKGATVNPSESDSNMTMPGKEILLFQLGPVQDFIAQARSTRDLWSGSYMLSWLVAHAIHAILETFNLQDEDIVMPSLANNPLILALRDPHADVDLSKVLVPNLPNRILAILPEGKGLEAGRLAQQAIRDELARIGDSVWTWLENNVDANPAWRPAFDAQIKAFPQMAFATVPWDGRPETWAAAHDALEARLAARRNVRDFAQWPKAPFQKDSLSGKEEVIGNDAFWRRLRQNPLFNKAQNHRYGAINLLKRLWIKIPASDEQTADYLARSLNFSNAAIQRSLDVPSTQGIAKGNTDPKNPYLAVLAFDGDHMGEKISAQADSADGIQRISRTLSAFALDQVPGIVERHHGYLIYAGGDDVLALLPSSRAVACARAIERAFEAEGSAFGFTGSCGIAVGHKNTPLQMLVQKARDMEHVAKDAPSRGPYIASMTVSNNPMRFSPSWRLMPV